MKCLVRFIVDQSMFSHEEMLYISNSRKLIKFVHMLGLDALYDPILSAGKKSKLEAMDSAHSERLKNAKVAQLAYCLKEGKDQEQVCGEGMLEGAEEIRLGARDLILYPFISRFTMHAHRSSCVPNAPVNDIDESIFDNRTEDIRREGKR